MNDPDLFAMEQQVPYEIPWHKIIFWFGLLLSWVVTLLYAYHLGYQNGWQDLLVVAKDKLESLKYLN